MFYLLKFRSKQAGRLLKELGIFYSLVGLAFFFFFLIQLYQSTALLNIYFGYRVLSLVILWIFLTFIHLKRPDKIFLSLKVKHCYLLYLSEYILLSAPITLWFAIAGWYFELVVGLGGVFIIPLFQRSHFKQNVNTKINFFLTRWISIRNYVWLAGIRKCWFIISLLYILSIVLLFYQYISIILLLVITLLVLPSFYLSFEPLIFIECQNVSPITFLFKEVLKHYTAFMLLLSPILTTYFVIHANHYLLIFISVVIPLFIFIWLNYFKYYNYRYINYTSAFYKYICTGVAFTVPVFFPILFVIMLFKRKKLRSNISYYIHD